jgi:asparagine synthase (glutamine-hydrolysing)
VTALAGLWDFSRGGAADRCARMLKAQQIYGPHHSAQANDGPLSLGRNLFRLLPEDVHDRGPVRSEDGRRILVADVRIDNRDELADQLGCGTTLSDAAVLMRALEHWGEAALDHVIGDFAFAYWDGDRLLLARDFRSCRSVMASPPR